MGRIHGIDRFLAASGTHNSRQSKPPPERVPVPFLLGNKRGVALQAPRKVQPGGQGCELEYWGVPKATAYPRPTREHERLRWLLPGCHDALARVRPGNQLPPPISSISSPKLPIPGGVGWSQRPSHPNVHLQLLHPQPIPGAVPLHKSPSEAPGKDEGQWAVDGWPLPEMPFVVERTERGPDDCNATSKRKDSNSMLCSCCCCCCRDSYCRL
jgi:hypothetical protein